MNGTYVKKTLAVAVILLFFSVSVIPSGTTDAKKIAIPASSGNTLYVGGSGPGNYTRIQDAIDDASDEDTVFVYDDSSPYYDNLNVSKSINLIGEDRDTTVIDGSGSGVVVGVSSNFVNLTGFTVRNSNYIGVYVVDSNYCRISGNIIKDHINENNVANGISLKNSSYIAVSRNNITDCNTGIFLWHRNDNCSVSENFITNNGRGIEMWDVVHCNISMNTIIT